MKKTILVLVPLVLLASAFQLLSPADKTTPANIVTSNVKQRIDATLKNFIDSGKIAGVSALVFEKGKEVYFGAFGYADREAKMPMDRNTVVRIFSMTKPVTGVALMSLYDKGLFQLDDPLSKYLPEYAHMQVLKAVDANGQLMLEPAKRPITIRDITRHTAGFAGPDVPALAELVRRTDAMNTGNTLAEMSRKLASLPLQFHPGDQWAYGNSVDVQARLVEVLSGKPFDRYVREAVLDPLQMNHTRYLVPDDNRKYFAALYNRSDDGTLTRAPDAQANTFNTKDWPLKPGGYGLTSTLDDYMKFAQMLVNHGSLGRVSVLKPETVKLMATSHLSDTISRRMWLPSKGRVGFGIDFAVRTQPPASAEENNGAVGEFFWDGAASTVFWVDPQNELTAVLFTQLMPFDRVKLHKRFRDAIYGRYLP
ncbi:serine hydrolase domain-containing protein [Sediminibacterium soli]|uniref:serine hydrolase domain-containing protein n=1 Tax=Sediminibacterium soli TaxID=2698829 RepID=UPI0013797A5D|nr:serine hydrolase domain-containing protein [Sediminibacterium soli]NCI47403.1 beta-lactamase family protein [Sediminibacterium soli]